MRATPAAAELRREPALDGVRGFAAVSVLLLHTRVPFARGGFYAVDVFFALSGFLITRLLLRERARYGRIDVPRFWARRTIRLWPPLAALLLLGIPFAAELSPGGTGASYAREAIAAGSWSMNIATSLTPSVDPPLGHTWSLGAEEQYYLVWPLVIVLALMVHATMRRLAAVCCALAITSYLVMVLDWHATSFLPAVYTRPDARAFDLLAGSALALALGSTHPPRRLVGVAQHPATGLAALAVIVAAVIVPSFVAPDLWLLLTVGAPLVTIAACLLVAQITLHPHSSAARVMGSRPGRASGTISYSLYLVHQPVLSVVYAHDDGLLPRHGVALHVTELAIALTAAGVLWVAVERPAHQLSRRITPRARAAAPSRSPSRARTLRTVAVSTLGFVPLAFLLGGAAAAAQWTGPPVVGDEVHAPGTTGPTAVDQPAPTRPIHTPPLPVTTPSGRRPATAHPSAGTSSTRLPAQRPAPTTAPRTGGPSPHVPMATVPVPTAPIPQVLIPTPSVHVPPLPVPSVPALPPPPPVT